MICMGFMNVNNDVGAERTPVKQTHTQPTRMTKKNKTKYKKAPQAPRRFKSAYMFFSTIKHKEIREELGSRGVAEKTTNIAKLVSVAWKELSPEDRELWEEMARKDKARFEVEKSLYTGPWKVPAKKRSQKDPNAPKRPMSAFLAYSHAKRAEVKKKNQNMNNAEISRVLAQMWKGAPEEEKKDHIEKEYNLRQKYLSEIAVWRENTEKELNDQRKHREDIAMKTVAARGAAMAEDARDPSQSHHPPEGAPPPGYAGYYPPPHHYYSGASSQAGYGQDYRHQYASYYPPPPSSQYDHPPPGAEGAQEGYDAGGGEYGYPSSSHYGYYPPGGPPPGGAYPPSHDYPPGSGYSGSYGADSEYPPPPPHSAQGYGSYYDQQAYPPPPREGEGGYDRSKYPADEGAAAQAAYQQHGAPPPYHDDANDDSKPPASGGDRRRDESAGRER